MNKKIVSLLISGSLVLGASQAFAGEITIPDFNPGTIWSGPGGIAGEDNETEPGTVQSQIWDMEAFVVSGSTLYIIGGYNMQAGAAGAGGSTVNGMLTPGDLFIKVDTGATGQPTYSPTVNPPGGLISNAGYGYTHVIDLTQTVGATGSSATVYSVDANSQFNTVVYDQFRGNPWKYSSAGTSVGSAPISYISGKTDAYIASNYGVVVTGGGHNVLAIDLSLLNVPVGVDVWFSYTMECGNDSLKGQYSGGFYRTPDAVASVLLIGLGLGAMAFFGYKRR